MVNGILRSDALPFGLDNQVGWKLADGACREVAGPLPHAEPGVADVETDRYLCPRADRISAPMAAGERLGCKPLFRPGADIAKASDMEHAGNALDLSGDPSAKLRLTRALRDNARKGNIGDAMLNLDGVPVKVGEHVGRRVPPAKFRKQIGPQIDAVIRGAVLQMRIACRAAPAGSRKIIGRHDLGHTREGRLGLLDQWVKIAHNIGICGRCKEEKKDQSHPVNLSRRSGDEQSPFGACSRLREHAVSRHEH